MALSQAALAAKADNDPYEGYNRVMFTVNDHLDHYVMTPVAKGYRAVTPSPVRTGVRNFFNNLRDVVSIGSNLLRLDIEKASTDFVRVGINSTFGLGGLLNIAGEANIPDNKNTLGDTFASWGWKNSHYFVYPVFGPSTVRDGIGSTVTLVYPVQNAVFKDDTVRWSTAALNGISGREALLDLNSSFNDAAIDRYAYMRDAYMSVRNKQVGGTLYQTDDNDDIDSLVPADEDTGSTTAYAPADKAQTTADTNKTEPQHTAIVAQSTPVVEETITAKTVPQQQTLNGTSALSEQYLNYWQAD
ncbi:VacJ family lipoprotein [Neisseriaceae bacterium ESL0693]|nr:VacJ family lipoprotein [Neisseriaceae bacterium ESL0693]